MRNALFVGGLAAFTLAAAAGVAVAQQAQVRHHGPDADGDGRVSQSEFVARRVERLTAADADHDGSVTPGEMQAAMQAHRAERVAARFDRMDADHDGALSRTEFEAPRASGREDASHRGMGGHGRRGMGDRWGGERHADGRTAGHGPIAIADVQARTEQAFARLDADHDGFVTRDERGAAREQMRARSGERRAERQARRQASPSVPASE